MPEFLFDESPTAVAVALAEALDLIDLGVLLLTPDLRVRFMNRKQIDLWKLALPNGASSKNSARTASARTPRCPTVRPTSKYTCGYTCASQPAWRLWNESRASLYAPSLRTYRCQSNASHLTQRTTRYSY